MKKKTAKQIRETEAMEKLLSTHEIDDLLIKLDPFLRPERVAKYLDVSSDFVYDKIARKDLEAQTMGRLKRVRLSSIFKWLERQMHGV